MSRVRPPLLVIERRRTSASSSGETTISSVVVMPPSRARELGAILGERHLVGVRLDAAGLVAGRPDLAAVDVAQEDVAARSRRGSRPRASA